MTACFAATTLIAACGSAGTATGDALDFPGRSDGDFFYPEFQRWRIVGVKRSADAKVPADAGGIPSILAGRSIYLGPGYFTFPSLNREGDIVQVACFRRSPAHLRMSPQLPSPVDSSPDLDLRAGDGGRAVLTYGGMFDLTLERRDLDPDGDLVHRRFDNFFSATVAREKSRLPQSGCALATIKVPPLVHHDLVLQSVADGRRITVAGADLDPATPISRASLSQERRQKLDPSSPANTQTGCVGQLLITRIASAESGGWPSVTEYLAVAGLAGQEAGGAFCERVRFLRRLDPDRLLDVAGVSSAEPAGNARSLRLLRWLDDGSFRAQVGGYELEITILQQPTVLVNMISALPGPERAVATSSTPPRVPEKVAAEPPPSPPPPATPVDSGKSPTQQQLDAAFVLARAPRAAIAEYRLTRGAWPTTLQALRMAQPVSPTAKIEVEGGTIVIYFAPTAVEDLRSRRLVLRPIAGLNATIYWACGYATPDVPMLAGGTAPPLPTTVDRSVLPADCR